MDRTSLDAGMVPRQAVKDVSSKRLINNETVDVNQLVPMKYTWAYEHWKNGNDNHWLPHEVQMATDIAQWKSDKVLTEPERLVIRRIMGFFSTAESLVANNVVLSIFRHLTNAECRLYLLRQAFEEAVHSDTMMYIIESLGLDEVETFGAYANVESIRAKDEFEMELTAAILNPDFTTATVEGAQLFLENLIGFYVILEGIFFYSAFAMVQALHRQNKMKGLGEQFQYITRDEAVHMAFGIDVINGIKEENPELWTAEFRAKILHKIDQAVLLECAFARDTLPEGFLGLTAEQFEDYVRFIADRRLERIGFSKRYNTKNPFTWMSEALDLGKEKNFFETRVTDYRKSSSLSWD